MHILQITGQKQFLILQNIEANMFWLILLPPPQRYQMAAAEVFKQTFDIQQLVLQQYLQVDQPGNYNNKPIYCLKENELCNCLLHLIFVLMNRDKLLTSIGKFTACLSH